MPALVSAALIVRDEAAVLGECLASIRRVVDEIVVVDTGSVDATPVIAANAGARIHHFPWSDDFAAARNTALDHCSGEWILYIDADERLAPVTRAELVSLVADIRKVAFRLLLRPRAGHTPYREYRLWRHDPRIRFEGAIHEKVVPSIHAVAAADGRVVGDCDLLLEHVGYEGDQTRKHRRNLPLLRHQLEIEPENLFNWHHLFRVLSGLGEHEESERVLVYAVEIARAKPFVDPAGVLAYADLIAIRHCRGEDPRDLLREACARYPDNCVLWWWQARLLITEGRYHESMERLDALAGVDAARQPAGAPAYDERLFGDLVHDARGLCLFRLGRYDEAASAYGEALRSAPTDVGYRAKYELALARATRTAEGSNSHR